jgi:hypothetical protein
MGTLTDDDLRHLLGEAAASYDEPDEAHDDILDAAVLVPLHRRRAFQVPAAAAVVALALLAGTALFGGDDVDRVGQLAGAPNKARCRRRPQRLARAPRSGPRRSSPLRSRLHST